MQTQVSTVLSSAISSIVDTSMTCLTVYCWQHSPVCLCFGMGTENRRAYRSLLTYQIKESSEKCSGSIAKQVGIEKPLSSKAGRHTYATIFLRKTKDLSTLKDILGHSDYRETLIYAHVMEDSKIDGARDSFNSFSL